MFENHLPDLHKIFGSVGKVKILLLLAKTRELNITAISKNTGLNHSSVKQHIFSLQKLQIVQEKRFGRIRIVTINSYSEAGRKLLEFLKHWNINNEVFEISF